MASSRELAAARRRVAKQAAEIRRGEQPPSLIPKQRAAYERAAGITRQKQVDDFRRNMKNKVGDYFKFDSKNLDTRLAITDKNDKFYIPDNALVRGAKATEDQIRKRAKGPDEYELGGKTYWNPFWYH